MGSEVNPIKITLIGLTTGKSAYSELLIKNERDRDIERKRGKVKKERKKERKKVNLRNQLAVFRSLPSGWRYLHQLPGILQRVSGIRGTLC